MYASLSRGPGRKWNIVLTLGAIEEVFLIGRNTCGVLGLLDDAEECLECTNVGEGQLGEGVVLKVCLGAGEDGCRVVRIELRPLGLALRAVDVPPGVAKGEVPGYSLLVMCVPSVCRGRTPPFPLSQPPSEKD